MQAVILCAGNSTRTYPLTETRPKPLLKAANKEILIHNLEQLQGLIKEAIIVVGFKKEMIHALLKEKKFSFDVSFVEQKEINGNGGALLAAKEKLNEKFLILNGDDFYSKKDLEKLLECDCGILIKEVSNPERFGIIEEENGFAVKWIEKPLNPKSNLANTGAHLWSNEIFELHLKKSGRGELELTDYFNFLIKKKKIKVVKSGHLWIPVGYCWNLLEANELLLNDLQEEILGTIEENVFIKGTIRLGKNSLIKSGTYLEGSVVIGENTEIGPNAYIRGNTSIGDNCKIGNAVEVKNSIIGNNSKIPHLSYIGDSVIGENVNLGAGTKIANLRHDHKSIMVEFKEKKIDSRRKKLGAIIGDNVKTGINTSINPGIIFAASAFTQAGEIVKKNKLN